MTSVVEARPSVDLVTSPLRVCFTSRTSAGSWVVRGAQMSGQRSNWHAIKELSDQDLDAYDLYCFVKRPNPDTHERLLERGKLVVLDVVDGWAQPADNQRARNRSEAVELFRERWKDLPPFDGHIFATRAMYRDLRPLSRVSTYIYHHYNPALPRNPLRREAKVVAYEGNEAYLGPWREAIEESCRKRGMSFIVNPQDHTQVDIGFAARGGAYTGYLPNNYKSNVKLANFLAMGTPCLVGETEVSYHETDPGGARFFASEEQLDRDLEALLDYDTRRSVSLRFLEAAPAYSIERIAKVYEHFFLEVARRTRR